MNMGLHTAFYGAVAGSIVAEPPPADSDALDPRVAKGCELLDRDHLGWANLIDLERFDLKSSSDCVIGQVYGDYDRVYGLLDRKGMPDYLIHPEETEHGFIIDTDDHFCGAEVERAYDALEQAWVDEISRRQGGERKA